MKLKSIGVLSLGKIMGIIYGVLGLIGGLIWGLVAIIASTFGAFAAESAGPLFGILLGVGAVIGLPLLYGFFGFLGGLLVAWIYNLVASRIGGLELNLEPTVPATDALS